MPDKELLFKETVEAFRKRFSRDADLAVAAPGRANLIGEHTDYNDGHVLPIAIDRFLVAAAANRSDRIFRLRAEDLDEDFECEIDSLPEKRPLWVSYMMGVAVELGNDGLPLTGKDILLHSSIPIGSGISSSAAVEVATATALERLEEWEISDRRLVRACQRADHNFVGIMSGPMDQFASRACRAGHAGLLDCRSLEMEHHPLPARVEFLSIYSGMPRTLATGEYNERQSSCRRAVEVLRADNPGVTALRDATLEMVEAAKSELTDRVFRRTRHVVTEQQRVFDLIEAFARGDLARAGAVLRAGHLSLSEDYEVSLPILDEMVEWLCAQDGVIGARLTGAGFGGSLICPIEASPADLDALFAGFMGKFAKRTKEPPEIWRLTTVDGAGYQPTYHP